MPFDHTKIETEYQPEVQRLFEFAKSNLDKCRPPTNYYLSFTNHKKLRFDFRKVYDNGELVGFRSVSICLSPHYYKNNNIHNADQFTPIQAIESFRSLFLAIGIKKQLYEDYKVVQTEFGLNIITELWAKLTVSNVGFYRRKEFRTGSFEYYRISNTDKTKQFKIYDKGDQFPEFGLNLLRIEIRLKTQRKISEKIGINNIGDLLKISVYDKFFEFLINDFDNIFFCEDQGHFLRLKNEIKVTKDRNKWDREKTKYFKTRPHLNAEKLQIKGQLIDTYLQLK